MLRTFSAPVEFDVDLLLDVFGQIKDVLLLGLFMRLIGLLRSTAAASGPSASTATIATVASSSCATSSKMTSLRHHLVALVCWSDRNGNLWLDKGGRVSVRGRGLRSPREPSADFPGGGKSFEAEASQKAAPWLEGASRQPRIGSVWRGGEL